MRNAPRKQNRRKTLQGMIMRHEGELATGSARVNQHIFFYPDFAVFPGNMGNTVPSALESHQIC